MKYSELLVRRVKAQPRTFSKVSPDEVLPAVLDAGKKYGIDPALLLALAEAESGWDKDAVSPKQGRGLWQITPIAERDIKERLGQPFSPWDPSSAAYGAAAYLKWLFDNLGDLDHVLAAWNWGYGNVVRHGLGAIPDETKQLIQRVRAAYPKYQRLIKEHQEQSEAEVKTGQTSSTESPWTAEGLSLTIQNEAPDLTLPGFITEEEGE